MLVKKISHTLIPKRTLRCVSHYFILIKKTMRFIYRKLLRSFFNIFPRNLVIIASTVQYRYYGPLFRWNAKYNANESSLSSCAQFLTHSVSQFLPKFFFRCAWQKREGRDSALSAEFATSWERDWVIRFAFFCECHCSIDCGKYIPRSQLYIYNRAVVKFTR